MSDIGAAGVGPAEIALALLLTLGVPVALLAFLILGAMSSPFRRERRERAFQGKDPETLWRMLLAQRIRAGACWIAGAAVPAGFAVVGERPGMYGIAAMYLALGLTQVWRAARDVQHGWAGAQDDDLARRAHTLTAGTTPPRPSQEAPA